MCSRYHELMETEKQPAGEDQNLDLTITLLRLLTEVSAMTVAVIGEVLIEFNLTTSAAGLLWALDPSGQPPTMRSLAQRLHCDPSTVSLMADKLEDSGLVERRSHPTDGRKRTLALTERGLEMWARLSHRLQETSRLSALDLSERQTLAELLMKTRPPLLEAHSDRSHD